MHYLFALSEALDLESPAELLLLPTDNSQKKSSDGELPIVQDGLTEKQRSEVLRLMGEDRMSKGGE